MAFSSSRRRRRARDRSACFRSLWWLLTREAALRVLPYDRATSAEAVASVTPFARRVRAIFAKLDTYQLRRRSLRRLAREPERREWP